MKAKKLNRKTIKGEVIKHQGVEIFIFTEDRGFLIVPEQKNKFINALIRFGFKVFPARFQRLIRYLRKTYQPGDKVSLDCALGNN